MRLLVFIFLMFQVQYFVAQEVVVRQPLRFLALGDSYTIGQSVSQSEPWPYQLKKNLEYNNVSFESIRVIARTGWTTSNLKSAIESEDLNGKYNLVALLIGVNNQYQGLNQELYVKEFEELLDIAIDLAGGKDYVFVLSIPDYGYTPFGELNIEQISTEIDEYNQINESITDSKEVAYFNITDISRDGLVNPSLLASDGLHPSGVMYQKWVELIVEGLVIDEFTSNLDKFDKNFRKFNVLIDSSTKRISFLPFFNEIRENTYLEIYSISGQKLFSKIIDNNASLILPHSGVYFYIIKTKTQVLQKGKIILN